MDFSHTLTLMAPYKLAANSITKTRIIPNFYRKDGTILHYNCPPSTANVFSVCVESDNETYTLADCPDFKTADAFVKIIDSLLQSFQS